MNVMTRQDRRSGKQVSLLLGMLLAASVPAMAADSAVNGLLNDFSGKGAGPFTAAAGEALWRKTWPASDGKPRSCTTCHGEDLRKAGRHAVTGKAIEPMAPSVLASRLQERAEIEKWFLRNCRWTLGRECTAQEKGDLLTYMAAQ